MRVASSRSAGSEMDLPRSSRRRERRTRPANRGAASVSRSPRRQSQAQEPTPTTTHAAAVEVSRYMKWAADSPRATISWLTARDRVPAESAVNQRRGRRAIRSPTAWWTSCMKPSAPDMPRRRPWKSQTAAPRPRTTSTMSQPPKDSPHRGAPVARATEAGSSTSSASPTRTPLTPARAMHPRVCLQEESVMSRRKRDSSEAAGREDPPGVEGTGSAAPVHPSRSSVREDAAAEAPPSAAPSATLSAAPSSGLSAAPSASAGPTVLVAVSSPSTSVAPSISPAWRSRAR